MGMFSKLTATLGALGTNPASPMVPGSKSSDVFSKTGQTQPSPMGTPKKKKKGALLTLGGLR